VPNVVGLCDSYARSLNWNLEIDREWIRNSYVRLGYQQRENTIRVGARSTTLGSGKRSCSCERTGSPVTAKRRSRAVSVPRHRPDRRFVHALVGVRQSQRLQHLLREHREPVIRADARGPLPWDAPNRYLFWSNISLPRGFTVFPLVDVRTGFPLSTIDENRNFVGARNEAGRYPTFRVVDMQVSKRLHLFGHSATIGLKVFNITNHFNPRDYQGIWRARTTEVLPTASGERFAANGVRVLSMTIRGALLPSCCG